jgi:hypothetical protein
VVTLYVLVNKNETKKSNNAKGPLLCIPRNLELWLCESYLKGGSACKWVSEKATHSQECFPFWRKHIQSLLSDARTLKYQHTRDNLALFWPEKMQDLHYDINWDMIQFTERSRIAKEVKRGRAHTGTGNGTRTQTDSWSADDRAPYLFQ